MKRIAIPVHEGKLSAHFGQCSHYEIVELSGAKTRTTRFEIPPVRDPHVIPSWIADQHITDIIAYKMHPDIVNHFIARKINVFVGAPLEEPEALINEYLAGTLVSDGKVIEEKD